jgi:hypothetical protein
MSSQSSIRLRGLEILSMARCGTAPGSLSTADHFRADAVDSTQLHLKKREEAWGLERNSYRTGIPQAKHEPIQLTAGQDIFSTLYM